MPLSPFLAPTYFAPSYFAPSYWGGSATTFLPIEQALETYLIAQIAGLSLWPLRVPQTVTAFPVATWNVINAEDVYDLDGFSGTLTKTFQFKIYAFDPLSCLTLAESFRLTLAGKRGTISSIGVLSSYRDDETWEYFEPEDGSDDGVFELTSTYKIKHNAAKPASNTF